jgi:hypothetical protein
MTTISSCDWRLFVVLCLLAGLLVMVGLWLEFTPGSIGWSGWWSLIRHILDGTLTALSLTVQALLWGTLPALFVAAWREGRRAAQPPRWLFSPDERAQQDAEITADVITAALRHVKIPALTRYLTGGGVLEYVVTPREQGGGTYTQVRLPMGVTAAELLSSAKVELLAGNLGRHRHEVWPQREKDTDARVLDLWVADKGTMDKPAPPWPLLAAASVNAVRRATEPCRVRPDRFFPPEVLLPGQIPAQLARWPAVRNTLISAPHSASSMIVVRSRMPGMVHTRLRMALNGAAAVVRLASSSAMAVSRKWRVGPGSGARH